MELLVGGGASPRWSSWLEESQLLVELLVGREPAPGGAPGWKEEPAPSGAPGWKRSQVLVELLIGRGASSW